MRPDYLRAFGFVADELVNFGHCPVPYRDLVPVVVHVQHEVLAHDSEANQPDVTEFILHYVISRSLRRPACCSPCSGKFTMIRMTGAFLFYRWSFQSGYFSVSARV